MNLAKLNDDLIGVVARSLHYFDNQDTIFSMKTAKEVQQAIEGGIARYEKDPQFAAKVKSLVAQIMITVQSAAPHEEGK